MQFINDENKFTERKVRKLQIQNVHYKFHLANVTGAVLFNENGGGRTCAKILWYIAANI